MQSTASSLIRSNNRSASRGAACGSNIVRFMSKKKWLERPEDSVNSRFWSSDRRRMMARSSRFLPARSVPDS